MQEFFHWIKDLANPNNLETAVNLGGPAWVGYAVLTAIIFSETGLLIGFFLPGDSLLFGAGFLASKQVFDPVLLIVLLSVAAIVGDAVNFYVGTKMGEYVFDKGKLRFVKHSHLMAAKAFYDRHGGKAIVLARFVPLVRTFTPFVAGIARMNYRAFVVYNIAGGAGWVISMILAGYWLGQIPLINKNFEVAVLGIVFISVLPVVIGAFRHHRATRAAAAEAEAAVVET